MTLERFNILRRHFTQWRNAPFINQDMQPSCLTFLGLFTLLAIIRSLCIIRLVRYAVGRDLSAGRHDLPRPHLRRWEPRSVPFGALVLGWFCHRYFKTDIYIYIFIYLFCARSKTENENIQLNKITTAPRKLVSLHFCHCVKIHWTWSLCDVFVLVFIYFHCLHTQKRVYCIYV